MTPELIKAYFSQFLKSMKDKELFVATLAVGIISSSLSSYNFAYEYIFYLLALGVTLFLIFGVLSYKRYAFLYATEEADIESDEHLDNLHDRTFYSAVFLSGTILLTVLALLYGEPLSRDDVIGNRDKLEDTKAMVEKILANSTYELKQRDDKIKELENAVDALKQAKVNDSEKRIPQALQSLSEGNTADAKGIFREVAKSKSDDIKQAAAAYRHLGAIAFLDNTQEAYDAYKRATELDPENPRGWNQLGHILRRKGDVLAAKNAYLKVGQIGEALGDKSLIATSYGNIGIIHKTQGELDKALEIQHKALKLYEQLNSKNGLAATYGNIGIIHEKRGELDKALGLQRRALKLNIELGNNAQIASCYLNIGLIYQLKNNLNKALEMATKALLIYQDLENKEGIADAYGNIGIVYNMRKEFYKALEMQNKSLKLSEDLEDNWGIANAYNNIGVNYKEQGELNKAKQAWQKSLKLFQEVGAALDVERVQGLLDGLEE